MDDTRRRQDDQLLASLDKRLALVEQGTQLQGKAAEARANATDSKVDALAIRVESAITLWQNVTAEPAASPAGRTILSELVDTNKRVDTLDATVESHDTFITQARFATQLAKFAVGASLMALILQFIQIWNAIQSS